MHVRMSRRFIGQKGEQLEELFVVDSETLSPILGDDLPKEEPASVFIGTTYISVVSISETGQQIPMPPQEISFPIQASSRKEAFEMFEKSAKEYIQYLQDQEEKKRSKNNLYVPNAAEVSSISGLKLTN